VTGGTKGMGQAYGAAVCSERRLSCHDCTLAPAGWTGGCSLRTDGYRYGLQAFSCNHSHLSRNGLDSDILVNKCRWDQDARRRIHGALDDDWQKAVNVNLLAFRSSRPGISAGMIERKSVSFSHLS